MADEQIDMTAFEDQFEGRLSDRMDNQTFETLEDLRSAIADTSDMIDMRKGMFEATESSLRKIMALEHEVRRYLAEIVAQKRPAELEMRELRGEMSSDKRKLESLMREYAKLIAEIEAREKYRRDRNAIESATANAPWRKRAKKYQIEGAHRMVAAGRGIMGDMPGLGKTLQSIMAVNMLRESGKAKKVLVFTLKPVIKDFEREFEKWYPGNFVFALNQTKKGMKKEVLDIVKVMPECILLTNYEVWRKDRSLIDRLVECQFDTVILDEAHVFKTKSSVTFKAIQQIVYAKNRCNKCGSPYFENDNKKKKAIFGASCPVCEYRPSKFEEFRSVVNVYPMTGTWLLNKPHDLWPLLNLVDVNAFPDEQRFLEDYCEKRCAGCNAAYACTCDAGPRWRWVFRDGGPDRLVKRLGMKFTSRTRESCGEEFPPQDVKHHYFELDEEIYPKYSAFTKSLKEMAKIAFADGSSLTQFQTLDWYTRVRQAATWPDGIVIRDNRKDPITGELIGTGEVIWPSCPEDLPGESIIMDEAENLILEAVDSGDRVISASQFKKGLAEMERRLLARGIRVARYDGDTPDRIRQSIVDDFNENHTKRGEHKFDVLLVNYRTGSTGLNLSGAQQIVIMDREWNPGKEEQMLDRVRRLDSQYDSIVHILHVEGTATDLMDAIIDEKNQMIQGFRADIDLSDAMRKFLEG